MRGDETPNLKVGGFGIRHVAKLYYSRLILPSLVSLLELKFVVFLVVFAMCNFTSMPQIGPILSKKSINHNLFLKFK